MIITLLDGTPILSLGPSYAELPHMVDGRLDGSIQPVRFAWRSSHARSISAALVGIVVPVSHLDNGAVALAFSGRVFAQTRRNGRVVHLGYWDDGDWLESAGILVSSQDQMGPDGGKNQALELVFYPFPPGSALYGPAGTAIDRVPSPDDEDEGA